VPHRFRSKKADTRPPTFDLTAVSFESRGWHETSREPNWAEWRNAAGEVLTMTWRDADGFGSLSDLASLLPEVRRLAEGNGGGVVSVATFFDRGLTATQLIYKKQLGSGYLFTGCTYSLWLAASCFSRA